MDERALGKRLQLARRRSGLTQQELCQKAGLSYSTLAKIERGAIRSPSVFTVASISKITGVAVEDLLNFDQKLEPLSANTKQRSKTGVAFVYFDVGDVLTRFFPRAFPVISADSGVSADRIETCFWRHNQAACKGQLTLAEFNQAMALDLGLKSFDWQKYYLVSVESTPGALELVTWVTANYSVGLLSNSMPGMIDQLLHKKLLPDIKYDAIVDSSVIGSVKPETKIFESAQALAAREPNEILLVDNERPNRTAADGLGWQVIGFNDYDPAGSIERVKKALEF